MTPAEQAELARKVNEANRRSEHTYGKSGFVALVWGGEVVTV
ncbi:hypothetical protein [Streptomyces ureilyticus]|nr:hypothetical protein [Streptomyces ureilyticus]